MIKNNVIWNITKVCPWKCDFCCIGAKYISPNSSNLSKRINLLKNNQVELGLEHKLAIIDNLDSKMLKFDFSGGDPLFIPENTDVLENLSKKFGAENISLTSTSVGLRTLKTEKAKEFIGRIEFTYDYHNDNYSLRPKGYNEENLTEARRFAKNGMNTLAQIPLTKFNISGESIEKIYQRLSEAKIGKILLLKFSDSGRGRFYKDCEITPKEFKKATKRYKEFCKQEKGPKITTQIFGDKIIRSLNITNKGLLLSNPWAYNPDGNPKEYAIMGDLKKQRLSEICGKNPLEISIRQIWRNMKHGK